MMLFQVFANLGTLYSTLWPVFIHFRKDSHQAALKKKKKLMHSLAKIGVCMVN